MMRSLSSGVAGLRTHQTKMDVIGNNIANVNTYGFKASRVTFSDVYYQTTSTGTPPAESNTGVRSGGTNPTQIGYGSQVATIDMLNGSSAASTTNRALDIYLTGEGYITSKKGDEILYTRLGNLKFDSAGNLVDHTGNIVQGFDVKASGSTKSATIDVSNPNYDSALNALKKLLTTLDSQITNFVASGDDADGDKSLAFLDSIKSTIDNLETYGAKTKNVATQTATATLVADYKALYALVNTTPAATALSGLAGWAGLGTSASGLLTSVNGISNPPTVSKNAFIRDPADLLTYTSADKSKTFPDSDLRNISLGFDSEVLSKLTNVSIDSNGLITGTLSEDFFSINYGMQLFANETYVIGQIAVANFGNAEGLVQAGNSYYKVGANTGTAEYTVAGANGTGEMQAGYLEMSNVDISQEFTDMIITQRGFQANTRIITTSDEMLQELVNLKR